MTIIKMKMNKIGHGLGHTHQAKRHQRLNLITGYAGSQAAGYAG